jgi:hypothetical protein
MEPRGDGPRLPRGFEVRIGRNAAKSLAFFLYAKINWEKYPRKCLGMDTVE